jgi:hypothetical protein
MENFSCPACGKTSDLRATTSCTRCGCDLGPLVRILAGAVWHLRAAAGELRAGDWAAALEHAQRSWSLHRSPRAARLAFLAAAASGETRAALSWRRRGEGAAS